MDLIRENIYNIYRIWEILRLQKVSQPEKIAVIFSGKCYSYGELYCGAYNLAISLRNQGLQGKHIGICMQRSVHYLVAYFAVLMVDGVVVPVGTEYTHAELMRVLTYCNADVVIRDSTLTSPLATNGVQEILLTDELLEKLINDSVEREEQIERGTNEIAVMLHTSGSTSDPKRVMLTHDGVIKNASAHAKHLNLTPKDDALVILPMYFSYCNTAQIVAHFLLGGTLVLMDGVFTPQKFYRLINQYQITTVTAVPTIFSQILMYKGYEKYDFSTVNKIIFGGAPIDISTIKCVGQRFPTATLFQTYGLTEAGPRVTCGPVLVDGSVSCGTPIPGVEVKIVEDTQYEKGVGEIIVKSPGVMKGYYKHPKETSDCLRDGWLYTGDLGFFDGKKRLHIVGRKKNIIIRAGVNIYPEEIESYLLQHPAVKEIYVFGVPHDGLGEIPYAKIVLQTSKASIEDIKNYAKQGLATFKIPVMQIVDQIPHTYNNKIKRGTG